MSRGWTIGVSVALILILLAVLWSVLDTGYVKQEDYTKLKEQYDADKVRFQKALDSARQNRLDLERKIELYSDSLGKLRTEEVTINKEHDEKANRIIGMSADDDLRLLTEWLSEGGVAGR